MATIAFNRGTGVEVFPADGLTSSSTPSSPSLDAVLERHLKTLGLRYGVLEVRFDASSAIVELRGIVERQDQRERIVLSCGNVLGVAGVDDGMTVIMPSEVSRWRFVQPGDTFETIAKDAYRDPRWARALRSANQPLVGDTDPLPAGWLLRIPAVEQLPHG